MEVPTFDVPGEPAAADGEHHQLLGQPAPPLPQRDAAEAQGSPASHHAATGNKNYDSNGNCTLVFAINHN